MAVPEGTVQDVLDWVGDDPARAQEALDAERSGQGRTTLISQLEAIVSTSEGDDAVTETQTEPEQQTEEVPGPEQPDLVLDTKSLDTTVSAVHRRSPDVEVPEHDDMTLMDTIEADPVDYFQVAGSAQGAVFSLNGAAYALSASQVASMKAAMDSIVVGLSL